MQTFLPDKDFDISASLLDNKRLGKQRVECLQILNAISKGPVTDGKKTRWYNHACTRMWRGHESTLFKYAVAVCKCWIAKGFNDTCLQKITNLYNANTKWHNTAEPDWLSRDDIYASHRSNLLRKNKEFYGRYKWTESDNLPYVYPK